MPRSRRREPWDIELQPPDGSRDPSLTVPTPALFIRRKVWWVAESEAKRRPTQDSRRACLHLFAYHKGPLTVGFSNCLAIGVFGNDLLGGMGLALAFKAATAPFCRSSSG